jgi:hypothetical protein
MLHDILKTVSRVLHISAVLVLLVLACTVFVLVIVYPLWKFAVKAPQVYTVVAIGLATISLIGIAMTKTVRYLNPTGGSEYDRIVRRIRAVSVIVKIVLLAAAGIIPVLLVLAYREKLALVVCIALLVLYGILSAGVKNYLASRKNR